MKSHLNHTQNGMSPVQGTSIRSDLPYRDEICQIKEKPYIPPPGAKEHLLDPAVRATTLRPVEHPPPVEACWRATLDGRLPTRLVLPAPERRRLIVTADMAVVPITVDDTSQAIGDVREVT
jgi:hypothetical protein